MKKKLLAVSLIFSAMVAKAQQVQSYQLLPTNATANDNLKLVLSVFYGNCSNNLNYSFTRLGNALSIRGCYGLGLATVPCTWNDTITLGRLPAGTYTVTTASYISVIAANCSSSTTLNPQPNTTGSFTVGLALASRTATTTWKLSPTVLSATVSTLYLTNVPTLQQVSIYDLTGRKKASFEVSELLTQNGTTQIPLPNLPPALYLLRIINEGGQTNTQRFIRQ